MKKLAVLVLLLSGMILSANNLLENPDFTEQNNRVKGWGIKKNSCKVQNGVVNITLKKGQELQLFSSTVVLNQKERAPIHFGVEYKGTCATQGWQHAVILANLVYQDGTKESWPKVLIPIPLKADDWQKLEKTVNLPKPVKSFQFLILLKDETNAAIKNPYVREKSKKADSQQALIVLPETPLPSESFAAEELANHIQKMTDKRPPVVSEKHLSKTADAIFFIGRTAKAQEKGFDFSRFTPEQWQISSVQNGVIIGGGEKCGTLFGVYNYLENICGVRWYTVSETEIPKLKILPVKNIFLSGKPAFDYRSLYAETHDYDGHFLSRNRQNSNFSGWKFSVYDGITQIGPSVHTHCRWVNGSKYFKKNPEIFALNPKGKRYQGALCLMNPETRKAMIEEVRAALRKRYAQADTKPLGAMQLVNISHMDHQEYCHCQKCKDFAAKYQALSACDIDFINEVAAELKKEFPNVIFQTLAYTYTEKPPVGLKVADNVCVQMCDTTSNVGVSVEHSDNTFFLDSLKAWTEIAKNVMVWDYWITYNFHNSTLAGDLPCATEETTAKDILAFQKLGVSMVFSEMEFYDGRMDVFDYKQYLYLKLLENPSLDFKKLASEFANDYYGAAGKLFLEYRSRLAEIQKKWHPYIPWDPQYGRFTYLTMDFLKDMQDLFDRGEKILASDPVRLKRWRHARVSLDRAVIVRMSFIAEEFLRTGKPIEEFPFNLGVIIKRIEKVVKEQSAARYDVRNIRLAQKNAPVITANILKKVNSNWEKIADRYSMFKLAVPTAAQLPAELANISRSELHIFPLYSSYLAFETLRKGSFQLAVEKDSLFGNVVRREFKAEKLNDALHAYTYRTDTKSHYSAVKLPGDILKQPGWHWVKFGKIKVDANTYLALTSSWECQLDVSVLAGPERKAKTYDLWVRVRFNNADPQKTYLEFDSVIFK